VGRRKFIGPILQTWHSRDRAAAIDMIARERGPVARVMHAAMHGATRMQIDRGTLGDEIQRIARDQLAAIDSGMRGLELIAFLAPLFGFFGTVLALMGIGVGGEAGFEAALISTAAGLAISIVITVFYYLFDRRIERERATMESALSQILSAPARSPSSRREPARRAAEEPEYEEPEYEEEEYEEDEGYYEPEFR
jgi:biopolymer transport protein ExbB